MHSILYSINWRRGGVRGVMHYFLDFSRLVSCGCRVGVRGFCLFSVSFDIFLSASQSQSSTSSLVPNLHLYLHAIAMLCDSFDLENKRNLTAEIHRAAQVSRPCFLFPLAHCGTVYWKFHSWEWKHAPKRVKNVWTVSLSALHKWAQRSVCDSIHHHFETCLSEIVFNILLIVTPQKFDSQIRCQPALSCFTVLPH